MLNIIKIRFYKTKNKIDDKKIIRFSFDFLHKYFKKNKIFSKNIPVF